MRPESLNQGDRVIILSPAGAPSEDAFDLGLEILESWGLKPVLSENSKKRYHTFAGTDAERKSDFQNAIDNPEIKAIFCVRGGYGSTRIINEIDWTRFQSKPKWIIGYSDITTFHNRLNQLDIESMHATMPTNFRENTKSTMDSLKSSLFSTPPKYTIANSEYNQKGKAKGKLIGGNLSIIHNLIGTKFNIQFKDNILFLEEIGEYAYSIDRMLWAMNHAGVFDEISGLIIGSFTDVKDNDVPFPESLHEMILKFVKDKNIPVVFDFPSGHEDENWTLIMSGNYKMEVNDEQSVIEYVFPELD